MFMGFPKIRVLFVTTEPEDLARPDITDELQRLQEALKGGRASFQVYNVYHTTRASLMKALGEHKPEIVHFLTHGGMEGAFFENQDGSKTLVTAEWLIAVFHRYPSVRLVVLNACTSAVSLARPLVDSEDLEIRGCLGWSDRVREDDARSFVVDLYKRLAAGDSVKSAFSYAFESSSTGFADEAQPVLALRGKRDYRPGLWRAVHFAGLGAALVLLGLIGRGLYSLIPPVNKTPTTPVVQMPSEPRSDLGRFPPDEDHRPLVRIHLEGKALDVLTRRPDPPVTPRATPPTTHRPPDPTRVGATLTHNVTVTHGSTVTALPTPERRADDLTSVQKIEELVATGLGDTIPLLNFQATGNERAPTTGLTLQLSAKAEVHGGRWPNSPVHLSAQLMLDGRGLTPPRRLCTFTPGEVGEGKISLEKRFTACSATIASRIARWDDDIHVLIGAVPFMTETHYDPASHYISTQLVHTNLDATYESLSGMAVFALRHPTIGALPFRACADERIGGYLTDEPERFEACHKLYSAAQTQIRLPETRTDRIYLTTWRGGN